MKYYSFKKMYFPIDTGGTVITTPPSDINKDMKVIILIQKAIDKVFRHFKQESTKTEPLPFWLINSYNDFIKTLENNELSLLEKHTNSLKIAENLFVHVFINLGEKKAKELFIDIE